MTFTESDAQNDGLIKREVGKEMAKVAKSQNPELYEYFVKVAEDVGRDPKDMFGEMVVMSLNDEEYADRIFSSEVNMRDLRADEIRLSDVKYVQTLMEELGINENNKTKDPVEQLIEQRLQSVTSSPLKQVRKKRENNASQASEQNNQVNELNQRLANIEQQLSESNQSEQEQPSQQQDDGKKSVDDLWSSSEDSVDESHTVDEEGGSDDGIVDDNNSDASVPDDGVEEALEGVVGEPDDGSDNNGEEISMSIDIPSQSSEEDKEMFTSSDGVEE